MKLFMLKLGATPKGRLIEQHDVFFGIAEQVQDLIPEFEAAWQEAADNWHIDCWREVSAVDGWQIEVVDKTAENVNELANQAARLFFVNLGGYRPNEFEEFHHKLLIVAENSKAAIEQAKQTDFYRDFDFAGAVSHVDDKYGVDVDEIHQIGDVLNEQYKSRFALKITKNAAKSADKVHIGYLSKRKFLAQTD